MKETANNTLFVTGTDTSVGKTFVCARLLEFMSSRGMQAGYQKWVATGVDGDLPDDLAVCRAAVSGTPMPERIEEQVPYCFRYPASPHLAAAMEDRTIDPDVIVEQFHQAASRYDWLVVEGVGGILVPLRRDLLLADFLARLQLKTLVVARSGLGTLNHTLLTIEALHHRQIPVLGVVFSDSEAQEDEKLVEDNMRTIAEIGRVRVLGRLHRLQHDTKEGHAFMPVGQAILELLGPHG